MSHFTDKNDSFMGEKNILVACQKINLAFMKSFFFTASNRISFLSTFLQAKERMKIIRSLSIILWVFLIGSHGLFGQTATVTLNYGGGGFCTVCGVQDYQCSSNSTGGWSNNRTFTDPTPAGSVVTGVSVTYYGACNGTLNISLNGASIATNASTGWSCNCGTCSSMTRTSSAAAVLNNYVQGGTNTLTTIVTSGVICCDRIVVSISYTSCTNPTIPVL